MGEIVVFIILGISVVYIGRKFYVSFKKDKIDSCCQGCSGCDLNKNINKKK
ncbi:MAG: hypothetical protein RBR08_12945 [Desulforegulaceae bacterium]|jgi:hypothetical protein|nr:hypothetical protein [Desulforegulaceae bacterium]